MSKTKINSMKKQGLLIAFVCALNTLNAQSFPNGGFETWTNQTIYEDPQYWASMNMLTAFGAEETAVKTIQAHSGTYALKLTTSVSDIGNDGEMDTIPGVLMLGTADLMSGTGSTGYPFVHRPDSLVGWYKLISPDNDPFMLQFSATKWDPTSESQEMIGLGLFEGEASSGYIRFSIPINYMENFSPDSIQVFIGNSKNGSGSQNELYLDDLSFIYNSTAGLEEHAAQVDLYPNPVATILHIRSDEPVQHLTIRDLQGKQVYEHTETIQDYQLSTDQLTPGVYFCELSFSNGSAQRLKFVKQ